jgi:glutamyl/glutaminyl-tRNA synthetase
VALANSLGEMLSRLQTSEWNEEGLLSALKAFTQEKGVSMKIAYLLLTGKPQGLPLPQFLTYLGKEAALMRLKRFT